MPSTKIKYYPYEEIPQKEKEFLELRKEQEICYVNLYKSVGTPEQDEMLKIEKKLNSKEIELRSGFPPYHKYRLPVDPCPVESHSNCEICSLYYKHREIKRKWGQTTFRQCKRDEVGATLCSYAPYSFLIKEKLWKKQQSEQLQ